MQITKFLRGLSPPPGRLLLISTLLLAGSAVSLANPWLASLLAANFLGQPGAGWSTSQIISIWMTLLLGAALLNFFTQYIVGTSGEQLTASLRSRLYHHMQALPLGFHQAHRTGETLSLLSTDAGNIGTFVTDNLVQLLPAVVTLTGAFGMMLWMDASLALIAIIFVPVYVVAIRLISRRLRPLSRAWIDANSHLLAVVEESLSLLPAIKAFTREKVEKQRFEQANSRLQRLANTSWRIESALFPATTLLAGLGMLAMLWLGVLHIERGLLSAPQLLAMLLYARLLAAPLGALASVYGQLQVARGSAERIQLFFAESPEPDDRGKHILRRVSGHIRFERVVFAYPDRSPVLNALDLEISAGETIAVTGANGAGKSTLAHLLMRFADPLSGRIEIDGVDTRSATLASVRDQIGLVAQQILLLNGTAADNIRYHRPSATDEEVVEASRAAQCHLFIKDLPQAYDTIVGEQGMRLSGGQRQRIALARALLKDPPILILDEATAMFDPDGEQRFIAQSADALRGKTVIIISHRPATLALADRVLELRKGVLFPVSARTGGVQRCVG